MALLALHCGPRAGEIFGLTWQDIDFERGLVTLRHTKNGHVRHVPMTVRVREMLKNRESVRDSELVFPARNGSKRKEVSNSFERAVKDLGWNKGIEDPRQKVVFHSLRHTCASWLVMAGVPLYTVKEYLGHRQISQTERYAHLAPDSLQQATAAMNGIQSRTDDEKVLDFQESNATP
jgi:integrase